jgi:hypothetical protein
MAQALSEQAVRGGKRSAAEVAQAVFDAVDERRFYIYSHPQALAGVRQRMEDLLQARNPGDPYSARPAISQALRAGLRTPAEGEDAP